ncbi:MAG: hypothetical protein WDM91_14240 [Rhizomicrobium sp.]
MTNVFRTIVVVALSLALSGCIFFETPRERAMRKDPNFQAGYGDGCASANARGTDYRRGNTIRDDALYQASKPYRSGWAAGYSTCNNERGATSNPDIGGMPTNRAPGQL